MKLVDQIALRSCVRVLAAFACVAGMLASAQEPAPAAAPPPAEAAPPPPPPAPPKNKPDQVVVTVKVIEFQITKGVETGLSAYFAKVARPAPFGQVSTSGNAITTADLTFPTSTTGGISLFLDRIFLNQGDIEIVLQGLVQDNRATILAEPNVMVVVGSPLYSIVKTAEQIPYENKQVVGYTAVNVTAFQETGVILKIKAHEIIDDDGNWDTRADSFVRLEVDASVVEEGQRIVIALDEQSTATSGAISVPEFVSRNIRTHLWVRDAQVLVMGGLYRNTEGKTVDSAPWLSHAEGAAAGALERLVPGGGIGSPLSSTLGNRSTSNTRRELVFLIKSEVWKPGFALVNDVDISEDDEAPKGQSSILNIISDVRQGLSGTPKNLQKGDEKGRNQKGDGPGQGGEPRP